MEFKSCPSIRPNYKIRNRIDHIDQCKGIGITLIICSHIMMSPNFGISTFASTWNAILNSFYVPLFFILSGTFESSEKSIKKIMNRLIRLMKYILIFVIFGLLSSRLLCGDWSLGSVLYAPRTTVWFLITLFWITLFMGAIKQIKYYKLIMPFFCIGGILISNYIESLLFIGQALINLPFYVLGFYLNKRLKVVKFDVKIFVIALVSWICLMYFFYSPQILALNQISQPFITFYLCAISGSFIVIELCKLKIFRSGILAWYGRNSIVPMLVQIIFIWLLSSVCLPGNIIQYFSFARIACALSGACIPLFRNNYYDIFK